MWIYYSNNHDNNRLRSVIMSCLDSCTVGAENTTKDFNKEQEHLLVRGVLRCKRELSFCYFWVKLIEHFNILWTCREVVWPSQTGNVEWAP